MKTTIYLNIFELIIVIYNVVRIHLLRPKTQFQNIIIAHQGRLHLLRRIHLEMYEQTHAGIQKHINQRNQKSET